MSFDPSECPQCFLAPMFVTWETATEIRYRCPHCHYEYRVPKPRSVGPT